MGLEFLARVRTTTLWVGAVASLMIATYASPLTGLAFGAGALWSLVNLALIERLIVTLTGLKRTRPASLRRIGLALLGMLALFAAGPLLLTRLAPHWLMAGFFLPFTVIVLKAAARLLLESRAWAAITRRPWRAALVVVATVALAWGALGALPRSGVARDAGSAALAASETGAAEGHAAETTAAESHAAEGAEHGEAKSEGPQEFPNVIGILAGAFPHATWAHFLEHYEVLVYSLFIALLLCFLAFLASRNAKMYPGRLQNAVEALVEALHDFIVGILGPKFGPRYVPFLGTLFIYILAMNLFGLIPFMHSPTSNLNVTVALALTVFVYVQFTGFRELGLVGYFDHMLGNPRDVTSWIVAPLIFPIHLLGELAKPISLSCRLFGNIFGEDMLLVAFATLGVTMLSFTHLPFGLPLHLPFLFLALLSSTLQALVFTVLSTIYFLLMLPHDDHEHEEEAHHAHSPQVQEG